MLRGYGRRGRWQRVLQKICLDPLTPPISGIGGGNFRMGANSVFRTHAALKIPGLDFDENVLRLFA